MRKNKEYRELALEAADDFRASQPHLQSVMLSLTFSVLLDIKELLEGVDRRLAANSIVKKHGTKKTKGK